MIKEPSVVPAMSTRFVGRTAGATRQFTAYHETRTGSWALMEHGGFPDWWGVGVKKELPGLWDDGQIKLLKCTDRMHTQAGRSLPGYRTREEPHSSIMPASIMRPLSFRPFQP